MPGTSSVRWVRPQDTVTYLKPPSMKPDRTIVSPYRRLLKCRALPGPLAVSPPDRGQPRNEKSPFKHLGQRRLESNDQADRKHTARTQWTTTRPIRTDYCPVRFHAW